MQHVMGLDVSNAVFFPIHNESDLFSTLSWCTDIHRLISCLTSLRSNSLFSKLLPNASLNIVDMEEIVFQPQQFVSRFTIKYKTVLCLSSLHYKTLFNLFL